MKLLHVLLLFILTTHNSISQTIEPKKEKFPSYFGLQLRPILPSKFIGESELTLTQNEFTTTISQKVGYSFGGTVRAGFTKLLAIETGINFVQRNFEVSMAVADSNVFVKDDLSFITYDIPLNGLVYIQLGEQIYMNTSMGVGLSLKPTNVQIVNSPQSHFNFRQTGFVNRKTSIDLNANIGFEYRTEKHGIFYFGGSGKVPFSPLFELITEYKYQGYTNKIRGNVDGSFLTVDFKYFFPNIKNKGAQFQEGPIQ